MVADMSTPFAERAAAECVSDEALSHLKTYKYSSVDLSPVSKYILGPYVRFPALPCHSRSFGELQRTEELS